MKREILGSFFTNTEISNFLKILVVGAELLHEDGRTDGHDEANIHFSQFFESI